MKIRYFFSFLLIFLIFPLIVSSQDIDINDEIKFSEKDTKDILHSLIQVLTNEWIDLTTSPTSKPEDQAALITIRRTVRMEIWRYFFVEAPKEIAMDIIKTTFKAVYLVHTGDIKTLISKIEKMSVDEAKKYAMEWLLQNEIRVASGNLTASYESYNGNKQEVVFPYIIVYEPLGKEFGKVGISIYSSEVIKPPIPTWKDPWEGGIEKLPPFIIKINGNIGKGTGDSYRWLGTPEVEVVFDEEVPKMNFPKPSFIDKQLASLEKTIRAIELGIEFLNEFTRDTGETVKEKIKGFWDDIKDLFSGFNPKASVAPAPDQGLSLSDLLPDIASLGIGQPTEPTEVGPLGIGQPTEVGPLGIESSAAAAQSTAESLSGWELASMAERLDDIAEEIDIFGQEVSDFAERESKPEEDGSLLAEDTPETVHLPETRSRADEESELDESVDTGSLLAEEGAPQAGGAPQAEMCQTAGLTGASVRPARNKIIFSEIAWAGTETSSADEWIELKNVSGAKINLEGWQILDKDGQIGVVFGSGDSIEPAGFYLLERTDDGSVPRIKADFIFTGALNNSDEALYLFGSVCQLEDLAEANPDWPAGDSSSRRTMERGDDFGWYSFNGPGQAGVLGTPRAKNSDQNVNYYSAGGSAGEPAESPAESPAGGEEPAAAEPAAAQQEPTENLKILITEVQIKGSKANYDFIELYNPNEQSIDISGWQLKKRTESGTEYSIRLLPEGIIIPAKTYWLWASSKEDYHNIVQAEISSSAYLSTNNSIGLLDRNKDIIDALAWGSGHLNAFGKGEPFLENPEANQSLERKIDSSNNYVDTDNNLSDFEIQNCPNPKGEVIECYLEPGEEEEEEESGDGSGEPEPSPEPSPEPEPGGDEQEQDTFSPLVDFIPIKETQTKLPFYIFWYAREPSDQTPVSGLEGCQLRWSEEQENWNYWPGDHHYTQINMYKFTNVQNNKTYYFQVKARDNAGNESDWAEAQTEIDLPEEPPETEPEIEGCTDPTAINFNPDAVIDDNSCEYPPPEIPGCTDPLAENYNPEATIDDSTCQYPEPEPTGKIVINEIAWMGTQASSNDEWLELYNPNQESVNILNWQLLFYPIGQTEPRTIIFTSFSQDTSSIDGFSYFLMERTDDTTISDIQADYIYTGVLNNDGGILELRDDENNLIDKVDCSTGWFAGNNTNKTSMERISAQLPGLEPGNWASNNIIVRNGRDAEQNPINATPKNRNSQNYKDKIIYVDKNLAQDDPANHLWNTIQEGINDFQANWLIIVRTGIYQENLQITVPDLILRSEQGIDSTIIQTTDQNKNILEISANNIEVFGFTFQEAKSSQKAGIYANNVKNLLISENRFSNNYIGIHLANSIENIIKNNIFEKNRWGIYLDNSENNTIKQNTINSKRYSYKAMTCGIYLNNSRNNTILENQANDQGDSTLANADGPNHGICLISSNNNIIENNTAQNNQDTGDGIYLKESNDNTVKGNTLSQNQKGMALVLSKKNSLEDNQADNNKVGIYINTSSDNILKNNSMADNCIANFSISLEPDSNNQIETNNLVDDKKVYYLSNESDMVIDFSSEPGLVYCFNCENITLRDFTLDGRNEYGIYFYQTTNSLIENVEVTESVLAISLEDSDNNLIRGCHLHKNFRGLGLLDSENNKISGNIFEENYSQGDSPCIGTSPNYGISLNKCIGNEISDNLIKANITGLGVASSSLNNTFFDNTIENNTYQGIDLFCSSNNLFYHNNFIDNAGNNWGRCVPWGPKNQWHNSFLNQGNYYSDYDEAEEGCEDLAGNGFCDLPYPHNRDNDEFPFVLPDGWK